MAARHITLSAVPVNAYVQQNQPPGVPPLELTGERTLPDVPAENYWYRRHLAVYEWIAARVGGAVRARHGLRRGLRLGSAGAHRPRRCSGSTRIPRRTSTPGCATRGPNLSFERGAVETYGEPGAFDAVVFLQTIEHVVDPVAVLAHFRDILSPGGAAYVSTPERAHAGPAGRQQVRQPVAPAGVPGARSSRELCRGVFDHVRDARPVPRPQAPRCTSWRCGWDGTASTAPRDHQARSMTGSRRRSRPVTSRCGPWRSHRRRPCQSSARPGARLPRRLPRRG